MSRSPNENLNHAELENEIRSKIIGMISVLRDKQKTLGFAESCTGGLLSSFVTEQAGVSDVFFGSIISYDNSVKKKILNVNADTLNSKGAVSSDSALQMVEGARAALGVDVAVSITGIAGPSGGTTQKPVGTVFMAVAGLGRASEVKEFFFNGDRKQIQMKAAREATELLINFLKQ